MGVLPLLLPLGLLVYLHGSLHSVMEPGSRGVTRAQSDCLLRRPDRSRYICNRVSTAPTRTPSHRLQQMEAPTAGVATAPLHLTGVGRSTALWGTAKRIAGSPHPGGLAQQMPAPPTTMPCMPQMMPVQQPCPEWPATPYQQAVQPPKRLVPGAGREVVADTPQVKPP